MQRGETPRPWSRITGVPLKNTLFLNLSKHNTRVVEWGRTQSCRFPLNCLNPEASERELRNWGIYLLPFLALAVSCSTSRWWNTCSPRWQKWGRDRKCSHPPADKLSLRRNSWISTSRFFAPKAQIGARSVIASEVHRDGWATQNCGHLEQGLQFYQFFHFHLKHNRGEIWDRRKVGRSKREEDCLVGEMFLLGIDEALGLFPSEDVSTEVTVGAGLLENGSLQLEVLDNAAGSQVEVELDDL